jgi:hypothetical protein
MAKVTISATLLSTAILLVAFAKGIGVLHGTEVASHMNWSLAALIAVISANCLAMVHAAQSDRIIRQLRQRLGPGVPSAEEAPEEPG